LYAARLFCASSSQEELDTLGDELDQKIVECQRMNEDLRNQDENLRVCLLKLLLHRLVCGQVVLCIFLKTDDAFVGRSHFRLSEANTKVQRLTVQIESSQNEIAFLREEQDGDKIHS
jgi:hypothetical protein